MYPTVTSHLRVVADDTGVRHLKGEHSHVERNQRVGHLRQGNQDLTFIYYLGTPLHPLLLTGGMVT
jgi:hypothetical protein